MCGKSTKKFKIYKANIYYKSKLNMKQCLICKEDYGLNYIELDCNHTYCTKCFKEWYSTNKYTCYCCFEKFTSFKEVKRNTLQEENENLSMDINTSNKCKCKYRDIWNDLIKYYLEEDCDNYGLRAFIGNWIEDEKWWYKKFYESTSENEE
jgi:hypothetical protein